MAWALSAAPQHDNKLPCGGHEWGVGGGVEQGAGLQSSLASASMRDPGNDGGKPSLLPPSPPVTAKLRAGEGRTEAGGVDRACRGASIRTLWRWWRRGPPIVF
jgi:hypothetical protein